LCGADVRAAPPFVGRIQIRGEPTLVIVCSEFASVNLAALVVERRKDKRLAELPFVQDRVRALVETIDAYTEAFGNLLRHARIEIMRALRFRDGILLNGGFVGCAVEL
jgi:cephalosporin-C deacetylase-like acetyl esterase